MKRPAIVALPPLSLDRTQSYVQQIRDGLRAAMQSGRLACHARVPATRALARSLGVSRQVVVTAYEDLAASGHLLGRVGDGSYVAERDHEPWPSRPMSTIVDPDGHPILVWPLA